MNFLTYVNVSQPPPQPWVDSHALLLQGLLGSGAQPSGLMSLSLDWWTSTLARMHINAFRVDTIPMFEGGAHRTALLQAAAAATPGGTGRSAGSCVYALASLLNHSCDPVLEPVRPRNNAVTRFIAARDVMPGEQLTVCYVDQTLPGTERRGQLEFAYGFVCACPRCQSGD
jgi:hypothetical protein